MSSAQICKKVSSCAELEAALSAFPSEVVYRGQTKHHVDANGHLSMMTSFAREGCVPPLMLKWSQYANSVILALQGPEGPLASEGRTQAILQHYGWRSFYIDASNNPAVAAWFASHQFSSKMSVEMCEDAYEESVCLINQAAKYTLSKNETGHLYVISKEEVIRSGADCDDLSAEISTEPGFRLRFLEQGACMLGSFQEGLPESCVVAHIEAPVQVLAEFSQKSGFEATNSLFPSPQEDPVFKLLLASPWVRGAADIGVPTFVPGLRLPMYSSNYVKHLPASVALYSQKWVDDPSFARRIPELFKALFVRVPEHFAYGEPTGTYAFPLLTDQLKRNGTVVIEFDGLFRYAERCNEPSYYKGIILTLEAKQVSICALVVEHPGMTLTAWGAELGWHYSVSPNSEWIRAPQKNDCPCNAPHRHEQFLCPIERIEDGLQTAKPLMIGPLSMRLGYV
jgi:hypothetical protein